MAAKLLVIDNYDSFTFNLVQMFRLYPLEIKVCRSDEITTAQAAGYGPDYILISPGPKDPASAGISIPLIRAFCKTTPVLGVCLGMQCINEAFGGRTVRAPLPMHGKTCLVYHEGNGVFQGAPSPFSVARYHSLMIEYDRSELRVNAVSEDGVPMGVRHPEYPLHGVQFHPESFLTEHGFALVENFLEEGPLSVRRDSVRWKPENGKGLMPMGVGVPAADGPVFPDGAYL